MSEDAARNLREHQRQLDADGVLVGVSRQALDELLDERERLREALAYAMPRCTMKMQSEVLGCLSGGDRLDAPKRWLNDIDRAFDATDNAPPEGEK